MLFYSTPPFPLTGAARVRRVENAKPPGGEPGGGCEVVDRGWCVDSSNLMVLRRNVKLWSGDVADGLLIPFGLALNGRMVSPRSVARGLACACVCPQCGCALVSRQGEQKADHFAHYTAGNCEGARETSLHKYAKQVLCDEHALHLPAVRVAVNQRTPPRPVYHEISPATWWEATTAEPEVRLDDIQPDVLLTAGSLRVAVEIYVAHRVAQEKVLKLRAQRLDTVEIDLSGLPRDVNPDSVRAAVLSLAPRGWLHHTRGEEVRAHLQELRRLKEAAEDEEIGRRIRSREAAAKRAREEAEFDALRTAEYARRAALDAAERAANRRVAASMEREQTRTEGQRATLTDTELAGWRRAALLRGPIRSMQPRTPGAICARCGGTDWKPDAGSWSCVLCMKEVV